MRGAVLLLGLIGLATPARGEVIDKAANGFTIKVVLQVDSVLTHQAQLLKNYSEKVALSR